MRMLNLIYSYLRYRHPKKTLLVLAYLWYKLVKQVTQKKKSLRDQVVLITGSANGLGKNMAKRMAKQGAKIVLWDIDEKKLKATKAEIEADGGIAWAFTCNLANREAVYESAKEVQAVCGKVDILINNAGIVTGDWLTESPDKKIELTFKVNVLAHFWTVKAFLPAMLEADHGHIVTIASAAGHAGCAKLVDYCSSKFAAVGFDEALRLELSKLKSKVQTTCICPYYINTGMFDGVKTRFGFLLPILEENFVAKRIIKAIRCNEAVVKTPWLVHVTPLLRFLLSTRMCDWIGQFLGINESMDEFKGSKSARK